jgi:protein-export membrane protein SecD
MVKSAAANVYQDDSGSTQYVVSLEFTDEGAEKFGEITSEYVNQTISIWMDDIMISAPTVNTAITDGKCQIEGSFDAESATELANKISAGALPFQLETVSNGSISATLGENSLTAMAYAGVIALIVIVLIMIIFYRLPGFIASIALIGQVGLSIAAVSGYFTTISSFTMTLPGIAGLILSIGMGVDCNVITAERIKEELRVGRTLDGALDRGTKNSLSAIIDGNMTIVIVSIILMLVFGPSNILSFIFGESTTGTIYSFGYTLLVGVISNFIMGIFFTRLMLRSVAGFKPLRNKWLFGGAKNGK